MAKRVYEVAEEMGKSAAAVVVAMKKAGINKDAVADLTDEEVAKVKALKVVEIDVDEAVPAKKAATKKAGNKPQSKNLYCMKCGAELPEDACFCYRCGTKVLNADFLNGGSTSDNVYEDNSSSAKTVSKFDGLSSDVVNKISSLDGSVEQFQEFFDEIFYLGGDFPGASALLNEYLEKYPDKVDMFDELDDQDGMFMQITESLWFQQLMMNKSFDSAYKEINQHYWRDENFDEDIESLGEDIARIATYGFWISCYLLRYYKETAYDVKFGWYSNRIEELKNKIDETDDGCNLLSEELFNTKKKMQEVFGREITGIEIIEDKKEIVDVDGIQFDFSEALIKYSSFISDIYKHILENAIRIHKAGYLEKMRPTAEQEEKYALMVQSKLRDDWGSFSAQLNVYSKKLNKLCSLCSQLKSLNDKSYLGDILECGASTFLLGPVGWFNVARKMKGFWNDDKQAKQIGESLRKEYDEYTRETGKLLVIVGNAMEKDQQGIINLLDKTLIPAVRQIFDVLRKNGEKLRPLSEYIF